MIKKILFIFILSIILLISFGIYKENFIDRKGILSNIDIGGTVKSSTTYFKKEVINIYPKVIYQGDPLFIYIVSSSTPKEIIYDGKKLDFFKYDNGYLSIIGIDFNEKNLKHTIRLSLSNGVSMSKQIEIKVRDKIEKPLGIPEKLGGNTVESGKQLVSNLAKENAELLNIKTENINLWTKPFVFPLSKIFVTDAYGYDRKSVGQTIVHKGTDFRASIGTPVFLMNDGIVKIAKKFTVYGNTVVVDHGYGLMTLYMHMSEIDVKVGDKIKSGMVIGKSGDTGYAEAAHLHVSVKIKGVSIDPVTFLKFFGTE